MQQTADVEILWITVDVAVECLPAYGSFFSSAAVADGDGMETAADVAAEMTAACGSSFFFAAVADSETDAAAEMAAVADATADVAASHGDQITFCQTNQRRGKLTSPPLFMLTIQSKLPGSDLPYSPKNSITVFCYVLFSHFFCFFSSSSSCFFFFLRHSSSTS